MKKLLPVVLLLAIAFTASAQDGSVINLVPRSKQRGPSVMEALEKRQSTREFKPVALSDQDLSDLLWAARGVNRDNGKLTSPTARNSQDVDVYLCREDGVYLYDAPKHALRKVTGEDIRHLLERRPSGAPVCLLLVADMSRYSGFSPDSKDFKHFYDMGALDCGIVSQNISIFCAAAGLGTVPRAMMDHEGIRKALNLTDVHNIWLNHPVGHPAGE